MAAKSGMPEEARKSLDRALEMDPHLASAWDHLGEILWDPQDPEPALRAHRRALDEGINNPSYWIHLYSRLRQAGRLGESVEIMERLRSTHPDSFSLFEEWARHQTEEEQD